MVASTWVITLEELAPRGGEAEDAYDTRIIEARINCFLYNVEVTDQKVSQLKVAYRALKNALGMLLLLVIEVFHGFIRESQLAYESQLVMSREMSPFSCARNSSAIWVKAADI